MNTIGEPLTPTRIMPKKTTKNKSVMPTAIKDIKAKYGDDSIMRLDDKPIQDVEVVSTGSIGLDSILGVGGLPLGRVTEIYGPEATGKTTLALHVIAEAQREGMECAFIDAEHALDAKYARKIGVDTKKLFISQPSGGEDALGILEALVQTNEIGVVVIDSVAALVPRKEIEGEIGEFQVGAQARLMSQMFRVLTAPIAKSNTLVIFINQIRYKIGGYGNPETTAGGQAMKFYTSIRIDLRKIAPIKKGENIIGSRIKAKIVKNKVASPFRFTEFDIIYNEGISKPGELLVLGEKYRVIVKAGAMYRYGDLTLGRGYDAAKRFLTENLAVASKITEEIKQHYDED